MRCAIIDNSTLTAVQRLLGEIEVENAVSLDGDIAAFESLIQAILFYDLIFYIDDYKTEFRANIGRLGQYYEKLTSMVRFKDGERLKHLAKTEDIRFFGQAAHWKKPM